MSVSEEMFRGQDDLLDDSTIELFRQYLKEIVNKGIKPRMTPTLTWADN